MAAGFVLRCGVASWLGLSRSHGSMAFAVAVWLGFCVDGSAACVAAA